MYGHAYFLNETKLITCMKPILVYAGVKTLPAENISSFGHTIQSSQLSDVIKISYTQKYKKNQQRHAKCAWILILEIDRKLYQINLWDCCHNSYLSTEHVDTHLPGCRKEKVVRIWEVSVRRVEHSRHVEPVDFVAVRCIKRDVSNFCVVDNHRYSHLKHVFALVLYTCTYYM